MKLLRLILVAAMLATGAIRSTAPDLHARTARIDGTISPEAIAALGRLAHANEGEIVLSIAADGSITLSGGDNLAATLAAWALAHGVEAPPVPVADGSQLHSAEAVVVDDDTLRTDSDTVARWAGNTDQRVGLSPAARTHILSAATWRQPALAQPSCPRAPPLA